MLDLQFSNLGAFASCTPHTKEGAEWLSVNLSGEVACFGASLLIEFRYLADIVEGARAAGLVCEG